MARWPFRFLTTNPGVISEAQAPAALTIVAATNSCPSDKRTRPFPASRTEPRCNFASAAERSLQQELGGAGRV